MKAHETREPSSNEQQSVKSHPEASPGSVQLTGSRHSKQTQNHSRHVASEDGVSSSNSWRSWLHFPSIRLHGGAEHREAAPVGGHHHDVGGAASRTVKQKKNFNHNKRRHSKANWFERYDGLKGKEVTSDKHNSEMNMLFFDRAKSEPEKPSSSETE